MRNLMIAVLCFFCTCCVSAQAHAEDSFSFEATVLHPVDDPDRASDDSTTLMGKLCVRSASWTTTFSVKHLLDGDAVHDRENLFELRLDKDIGAGFYWTSMWERRYSFGSNLYMSGVTWRFSP